MTAKIKLNAASGGGSVSLKAPSTTTSNAAVELQLPVADGSANQLLKTDGSGNLGWATDQGGKILQVKQAVKTDTASYSTGSATIADSYFDISGLSVTLTPASGTKCLVTYDVNLGGEGSYKQGIAVFRDSTQIYLGDADGSKIRLSSFNLAANSGIEAHGGSFLDTHGADGSTPVTYKLQIYVATTGRTSRINRVQSETDDRYTSRLASSITIMEVAA
jgi:hypothetical protein